MPAAGRQRLGYQTSKYVLWQSTEVLQRLTLLHMWQESMKSCSTRSAQAPWLDIRFSVRTLRMNAGFQEAPGEACPRSQGLQPLWRTVGPGSLAAPERVGRGRGCAMCSLLPVRRLASLRVLHTCLKWIGK